MKYSLERILSCTLEVLNVSREEWREKQNTREDRMVRVREVFSLIACVYEGYSRSEVGRFLGKNHATIVHNIKTIKDQSSIYPGLQRIVDKVVQKLESLVKKQEQKEATLYAWLARSSTGILTVSQALPEPCGGYWIAEGSRPFPRDQFPQITYETGPAKVQIKVTLEENEKV